MEFSDVTRAEYAEIVARMMTKSFHPPVGCIQDYDECSQRMTVARFSAFYYDIEPAYRLAKTVLEESVGWSETDVEKMLELLCANYFAGQWLLLIDRDAETGVNANLRESDIQESLRLLYEALRLVSEIDQLKEKDESTGQYYSMMSSRPMAPNHGEVYYQILSTVAKRDPDGAVRMAHEHLRKIRQGAAWPRNSDIYWANWFLLLHFFGKKEYEAGFNYLIQVLDCYMSMAEHTVFDHKEQIAAYLVAFMELEEKIYEIIELLELDYNNMEFKDEMAFELFAQSKM